MKRTALAVAAGLVAFACRAPERSTPGTEPAGGGFPVVVEAANGAVRVPWPPARIVSLSPTATEMLFAIGAGTQVVAVDAASNYPEGAPKTRLSGFQPNIEAIAEFEPDLVVYSTDPGDLEEAVTTLGAAALLQPPAAGLEEAYDQILELGTATGRRREAERLVNGMRSEIEAILESAPRVGRPPTYYHELDSTGFTATSKTFIGEIYALAGLRNIADTANPEGGYVQLSAEYVIDANPDLIFLANSKCCGESADTLARRPGWSGLDAVRMRRVVQLDDDVASRWGPRTVGLLRSVVRSLRLLAPDHAGRR